MLSLLIRFVSCASCFACSYYVTRIACARIHMIACVKPAIRFEDILRDRMLCFLLFDAIAFVFAFASTIWILLPGIPCSWILAKKAPHMLNERRIQDTRRACDEQVDTMADIISMGVRSGLSFDAALDLYCLKFDNALSQRLGDARLEWKSGLATREEALLNLSDAIRSKALKRFSETSIQAIHHGSPLADMLDGFSNDIRRRKRNAVEQQIAKAPVKMLIPTGTCILPAMLILVMGPVLLQFIQTNM